MNKSFLYDNLAEIEQIIGKYSDISAIESIYKDINTVRNRLDDDYLYLGVVGTFSSGKSTFINSMIGKSILPTDAVQGTTVAASILKKSDVDDLEIKYLDGECIKYSTHQTIIDEKYIVDDAEAITEEPEGLLSRFIQFLKRLFWIGKKEQEERQKEKKREKIKKIYRFFISTESKATDIEYATLYVDEKNIDYNIALVDTPGTESLNDRHGMVTKNAIDNICDALIVVIPYDEPVSQELVTYIKQNIDNYANKCIFAVTKVELLNEQSELQDLVEWVRQKIMAQLEIENPVVIPMPTLLHLVDVDKEVKTSFFNDMEDETKCELLSMYESGLYVLQNVLREKRDIYLRERIRSIYSRITKELNRELNVLLDEKTQLSEELKNKAVIDLHKYRGVAFDEIKIFVDGAIVDETINQIEISNSVSYFSQSIFEKINDCKNSNSIISEIGNLEFIELFKSIQKIAYRYEKEKDTQKREYLEKIRNTFVQEYSICKPIAYISSEKVFVNLQPIKIIIAQAGESFEELKQELDGEIQRERKGFFKKIKNLFDDPTNRQISMVREKINSFLEQLEAQIKGEWDVALNGFKVIYKNSLVSAVQKMIDKDRKEIESYISKNNSEILSNKIVKDNLLKDIEKIKSKSI